MTDFPAPLSEPTPPDPKRQRILRQDWEWVWERNGTKDRIFIPKSTEDTLVKWEPSIPTWAQSFIPDDALEIPALPHDIIYKLQGEMPSGIIQRWAGSAVL